MSSHPGSAVVSRAVPSYRARPSSAAQVPMRRTGSRVSRRRVRRVRERRGPAGAGGGKTIGERGGGGGGERPRGTFERKQGHGARRPFASCPVRDTGHDGGKAMQRGRG